jgi:hypothetical protein
MAQHFGRQDVTRRNIMKAFPLLGNYAVLGDSVNFPEERKFKYLAGEAFSLALQEEFSNLIISSMRIK